MAFSTVKVYLAATVDMGFEDKTSGLHPLVCQFMNGARRLWPVSKNLAALWDLSMVLDALSRPLFEPLQQVELKMLSFKTALQDEQLRKMAPPQWQLGKCYGGQTHL